MVKIRDRIKYVSTSDLKEYEKNNKKHSEDQVSLLVQMIDKFGFTTPLLIDKKYNIIAGHGRKLAAEKLGMKKLPCIIIDDLSENEIKALRIADNRISELASREYDNIEEEYKYLKSLGSGIEFLTGYMDNNFTFQEDNEEKLVSEIESSNKSYKIVLHFNSQEHLDSFLEDYKVDLQTKTKKYSVKIGN
jgi:hypothetical protein